MIMRKKLIGCLAMSIALVTVISGCGSTTAEVPVDENGSGVAEEINVEIATDEDEPAVVTEEKTAPDTVDVQSLLDEDTMGFADGYVFDLSEVKIEEHQDFYFKISGSESVIETATTNDFTASEAAQTMADNLKASSGETPVMDYHDEGVYITGLYNDEIMLCFLADGPETTYIMSMRTVDTENSIKIFNSVISDFLAGGATDSSLRTEYGQAVDGDSNPVETDNAEPEAIATPKEGTYYNAPKGYECTYTCDFFENYCNDEYEYQFNLSTDDDLLDFAKGKADIYLDQKITKITEVDSSYGKVVIGERTNGDGYYRYHAVSADGTVNIEFNSYYSEQIDKSTCEKLVKDVLK